MNDSTFYCDGFADARNNNPATPPDMGGAIRDEYMTGYLDYLKARADVAEADYQKVIIETPDAQATRAHFAAVAEQKYHQYFTACQSAARKGYNLGAHTSNL